MNDLLTKSEIEQVTGAKQWSKIAEVLASNGIYFIQKANGEIATTWHHIHHPAKIAASSEPDFTSLG